VVIVATAVIVGFALIARAPQISLDWRWALALVIASVGIVAAASSALWKTTRFN
jgi:type IV secretory pathway VirB2 component (pilin)